jgi:hypothetical protein
MFASVFWAKAQGWGGIMKPRPLGRGEERS